MNNKMNNRKFSVLPGFLFENLGLKLFSVFAAFLVWLVVVDINDPIVTIPYTLKVTAVNGNTLERAGRIGRISEEYSMVKIKIRAPRSRQANIIADANLTATADLSQLLELYDNQRAPLVIQCDLLKGTDEILTTTNNIPVVIEDLEKKSFPIKVNVVGDSAAGYEVGTTSTEPEQIALSGPKSVLSKINTIEATVDVTGISRESTLPAPIRIIDKNGDVLRDAEMANIKVGNSGRKNVNVSVNFWKKRSGIRLKVDYSGEPAKGYQVSEITTSPEDITIAASEEGLKLLDELDNTIEISGKAVSVDNASTDKEIVINLQDYLPDSTQMRLSSQGESTVVKISILPMGSKQFEIPVEQIVRQQLKSGLTVAYHQKNLSIRIKATDEMLEQLDLSQIQAELNLNGLTEGDHTLPVVIKLPEGYELVDQALIDVQIGTAEQEGAAW